MRTKLVLGAAILAAGLASSMAQVYSANVVGYVNVTLPAGQFACVANPLDATAGGANPGMNDITNLFQSVNGIPGGSTIATFNSGINDYNASSTMGARSGTWDVNFTMNPGLGALFYNPSGSDVTVTFVGQVQQGTYTVGTLGAGQFSMVGSPVPVGGSISNSTVVVGLAPVGGDFVQTFSSSANDWTQTATWSSRGGGWDNNLTINAGQGFFYYNSGAANTWTSNFTVQ